LGLRKALICRRSPPSAWPAMPTSRTTTRWGRSWFAPVCSSRWWIGCYWISVGAPPISTARHRPCLPPICCSTVSSKA
jgi:hypothetical protein